MTSPTRGMIVVLGLSAVAGCVAGPRRTPPGPLPIPPPWHPEATFRAQLPRRDAGEVILDDRDGLSPNEAAVLAVDRAPALRSVRARRGIALAEVLTAGILPNPRLDTSLEAPRSGADAEVLGYGAGLSWNVTPLLSRSAHIAAAEQQLVAIDLDIAWREWQVGQSAKLHALRILYLQRRIAAAADAAQFWARREDHLGKARAAQAVSALDVARARRSRIEWALRGRAIERALLREQSALGEAIGVDPRHLPAMQTTWRPDRTAPPADVLIAHLARHRLDLLALAHARRSHQEALRAAALERFPPVGIGLHAGREVDGVSSVGLSLSFDIPVFDRNQGAVAGAHARRRQIDAEYAARLATARANVIRFSREATLLGIQLDAAGEAEAAATRLAELARAAAAAATGGLDPIVVADAHDHAFAAALRTLETEQALAETRVALSIASGVALR